MASGDKGKGRALPEDENPARPSDETSQGSSILSRIAVSANGLSRNLFAAPNSRELNDGTATALATSGKGQPSSSGEGLAWAESSRAHQLGPQVGGPSGSTFRPGHSEEHARQSEEEFSSFLDGVNSLSSAPSDVVGAQRFTTGGLAEEFREAWGRSQINGTLMPLSKSQERSIAEQEKHDGEDVLAILNEQGDPQGPFEAPQEDRDDYDWGLSAEQLSELRAMTDELFSPPEAHATLSPDHPLNLVPSFTPDPDGPQINTQANEAYMYFGSQSDSAIAREIWTDQWEGVLTRYTDEVWGALLPLVKEARKEVEKLRDDPSITDQPKALRRLGAILGHLRNHATVSGISP